MKEKAKKSERVWKKVTKCKRKKALVIWRWTHECLQADSLVFLLQHHHMKTNSSSEAQNSSKRTQVNKHRHLRKPQQDRYTRHFCLCYSEGHNMTAHFFFMLHRADRAGGTEGMKRLTANILLLYQRQENTQQAADRPPPVQTGVATATGIHPKRYLHWVNTVLQQHLKVKSAIKTVTSYLIVKHVLCVWMLVVFKFNWNLNVTNLTEQLFNSQFWLCSRNFKFPSCNSDFIAQNCVI